MKFDDCYKREKIQPEISEITYFNLKTYCKATKCTVSYVVEMALKDFFATDRIISDIAKQHGYKE